MCTRKEGEALIVYLLRYIKEHWQVALVTVSIAAPTAAVIVMGWLAWRIAPPIIDALHNIAVELRVISDAQEDTSEELKEISAKVHHLEIWANSAIFREHYINSKTNTSK